MRRMCVLGGVLALIGLLAVLAGSAAAQDKKKKKNPPLDPVGEPKGFETGESVRFAVWHGKNGWRLRTTTAKREHHFRGGIHIEGGTLLTAHSAHLEKEGKLQDHWKMSADRKSLLFDFKTHRGIDGINFTVSKGADRIRFNLLIDGKHQAERIFIGHAGQHPVNDPFTLVAHPSQK